jgi:hypothetical protein
MLPAEAWIELAGVPYRTIRIERAGARKEFKAEEPGSWLSAFGVKLASFGPGRCDAAPGDILSGLPVRRVVENRGEAGQPTRSKTKAAPT